MYGWAGGIAALAFWGFIAKVSIAAMVTLVVLVSRAAFRRLGR